MIHVYTVSVRHHSAGSRILGVFKEGWDAIQRAAQEVRDAGPGKVTTKITADEITWTLGPEEDKVMVVKTMVEGW